MTKAQDAATANVDDLDVGEEEDEDQEFNGSEVAASSDDGHEHEEGYRQDVETTLQKTGLNLKRGKTMAMREAITTAKKLGVDGSKITTAERQLEEHKLAQRRDEVEKELEDFLVSDASNELPLLDSMIEKAQLIAVKEDIVKRLQDKYDELIWNRKMSDEEISLARAYLKESCRAFVLAAVKDGGRPAILVSLTDGKKKPACMTLDAPLQNLSIALEDAPSAAQQAPISSLSAVNAKDDKTVGTSRGFLKLEEDDRASSVALRYCGDAKEGVWCLVEPTPLRRDRLIEAIVILTTAGA